MAYKVLREKQSLKCILGWCDKNVYRSWNKCAVSGKCYTTCTDGNCYEEVKNSSEEVKVIFSHEMHQGLNLRVVHISLDDTKISSNLGGCSKK